MKDTIFTRFWAIIFYPVAAMDAVRENPRYLQAGLLILLMVGIYAGVSLHITGPEQLDLLKDTKMGEMISEEDWQQRYDEVLNLGNVDRVYNGLQAGIGILISLLLMSLVYLLFSRLSGGTGTFGQILGVVFWSGTVGMGLAALVVLPIVLAKKSSMDVVLGPAVLVSDRGVTDFWFQLLSILDLFKIWFVVLIGVGFERIHGMERVRAMTLAIGPAVVITLIMFGFGRLIV